MNRELTVVRSVLSRDYAPPSSDTMSPHLTFFFFLSLSRYFSQSQVSFLQPTSFAFQVSWPACLGKTLELTGFAFVSCTGRLQDAGHSQEGPILMLENKII